MSIIYKIPYVYIGCAVCQIKTCLSFSNLRYEIHWFRIWKKPGPLWHYQLESFSTFTYSTCFQRTFNPIVRRRKKNFHSSRLSLLIIPVKKKIYSEFVIPIFKDKNISLHIFFKINVIRYLFVASIIIFNN